jgi:hypothetical protein
MEDDDGHPKVKMYADENGNFNGEALVVYFMEDSVRLAESILDEAELRVGDPTTRMRVRQGEFGHNQGNGEGGEVKRRVVDRRKATQRIVKMKKYVSLFLFLYLSLAEGMGLTMYLNTAKSVTGALMMASGRLRTPWRKNGRSSLALRSSSTCSHCRSSRTIPRYFSS